MHGQAMAVESLHAILKKRRCRVKRMRLRDLAAVGPASVLSERVPYTIHPLRRGWRCTTRRDGI